MARSGHSAVLHESYICFFGGIFEVTKELNDLHLYDIVNNRWICLFSDKTEPVSSQSPTKTMAMGSVSPLMRRSTMVNDLSPKGATDGGMKYTDAMMCNLFEDKEGTKKLKL